MYSFIKDKTFLKNMRRECSGIINQLVQLINGEDILRVEAHLVGSGAKNLETQNANEPIDLDYNLVILGALELDPTDCKGIKEYVRISFNKVLRKNYWGDCKDSSSVLTTKKFRFKEGNQSWFSIDLAIVCEVKETWYRLIHKKTGIVANDEYYWNESPHSKGLYRKVVWLKDNHLWNAVRDTYLEKKNMYLSRGDHNHPSFICYIEAVNEVYKAYK